MPPFQRHPPSPDCAPSLLRTPISAAGTPDSWPVTNLKRVKRDIMSVFGMQRAKARSLGAVSRPRLSHTSSDRLVRSGGRSTYAGLWDSEVGDHAAMLYGQRATTSQVGQKAGSDALAPDVHPRVALAGHADP